MECIIAVVAPHECLECGAEGSLLCRGCRPLLGGLPPSRCYSCYKITVNNAVCDRCRRKSSLKNVWVRCEYKGVAKRLIRAIKYSRAQNGTKIIAQELKNTLPSSLSEYVIVPIPTANSRKRQRGYDHAELIAKELATLLGIPMWKYLLRFGSSRQVGSKRAVRLRQLDGAFLATNTTQLKGQKVLLVDDVLTTGTTIELASRVIRKAGANSVSAVVFAQA